MNEGWVRAFTREGRLGSSEYGHTHFFFHKHFSVTDVSTTTTMALGGCGVPLRRSLPLARLEPTLERTRAPASLYEPLSRPLSFQTALCSS